jgi:hypothetical protein
MPLYVTTQDGSASCSVTFGQIYLTPRQVIDVNVPYQITASSVVADSAKERVTEFVKTGVAFGNLIVTAAPIPTGKVVVGALTTALASNEAKQLTDEINSFGTRKTSIKGMKLINIEPATTPSDSQWFEKTINYDIYFQPYTFFNIPDGPASNLGRLTVHVRRTPTVIGVDPVTLGKRGALPTYGGLSQQTRVMTFLTGNNGIIATPVNLYDLLNQTADVVTVVSTLPANSTPDKVATACGHLRDAIQKAAILNSLDSAAYLWWAYSRSPYARATEPTRIPTTLSPCLLGDEQARVKLLKIDGWPAQQPNA